MLIEHILESEANLRIAWDTADVFHDVQKSILIAGTRALIECVESTSGLRCVEFGDPGKPLDPMAKWAGMSFRNDGWPSGLTIAIEASEANAGRQIIGVNNDRQPLDERLMSMLNELRACTSGNQLWPWWYWIQAPYDRWTRKEALVGFRWGGAVETLATEIVDIATIIDRFLSE